MQFFLAVKSCIAVTCILILGARNWYAMLNVNMQREIIRKKIVRVIYNYEIPESVILPPSHIFLKRLR